MPRDLVRLGLREQADVRLGELVAEVGDEVADRAEQAGRRRHDHRERAHQLRDARSRAAARAAVGDEREVARVVTALDGDEPQRARHVLVDDREDALGRLLDRVEAHRVGDRLHRRRAPPRRRAAISPPSSCGGRWPSTTFASVTVGSLAALAVGGRARLGAGRLRADAERLRQLAARGRSSRRPRRPCGRRRTARVMRKCADRRLAPDRRLAVLAERDVGRRPAHVEREDVVEAGLARRRRARRRRRRTGRRARRRSGCAPPRASSSGPRPSGGCSRPPSRRSTAARDWRRLDVVGDLRPHVRVHAGRQRPLVLAELGQHVRARASPGSPGRGARRSRRSRSSCAPLTYELIERDGQRLDARLDEVADDRLDLRRRRPATTTSAARVHPLDRLARVGERAPADRA